MATPQLKFGFFLAFKQSVWPFSGLFLALCGFSLKIHLATPYVHILIKSKLTISSTTVSVELCLSKMAEL